MAKVKESSCRLAFAMTDFKLQGRALPKLILNICKRPTPPWMELAGFSRVRTMEGLRVLYRDEQGLAHLRTLQWKPQLGAWVKGYDDQGRWSDKRAAAAYKAVCAAQAILRDRRKAEKREVKAKAKAKPTTRKSKATRKAGAKGGANGKASARQTASISGIDELGDLAMELGRGSEWSVVQGLMRKGAESGPEATALVPGYLEVGHLPIAICSHFGRAENSWTRLSTRWGVVW